jgi:hypothetical protein
MNDRTNPGIVSHPAGEPAHTSSLTESRLAINSVIGSARKIIRIFERDLGDAGFRDPDRIRLLESFVLAARGNSVRIVLHDTHNLDRDCARLMALFRRNAHAFTINRTVEAAGSATDALVIADEHSFWHRLHQDQPRVTFTIGDSIATAPLLHRFEEIWESSEPAVAATLLGL